MAPESLLQLLKQKLKAPVTLFPRLEKKTGRPLKASAISIVNDAKTKRAKAKPSVPLRHDVIFVIGGGSAACTEVAAGDSSVKILCPDLGIDKDAMDTMKETLAAAQGKTCILDGFPTSAEQVRTEDGATGRAYDDRRGTHAMPNHRATAIHPPLQTDVPRTFFSHPPFLSSSYLLANRSYEILPAGGL